jgi:hypothetical protein
MRPTFNQTVNVLVQAYLNDTLIHGYCAACAVGNIVASSMGIEVLKEDDFSVPYWSKSNPEWPTVFLCTGEDPAKKDFQVITPDGYKNPKVKIEIDSTGYTWQELAKIEFAFESVPYSRNRENRMYEGLMKVVDVLAEIHGIDLSVKENAKLLFVR